MVCELRFKSRDAGLFYVKLILELWSSDYKGSVTLFCLRHDLGSYDRSLPMDLRDLGADRK